MNKNYCITLGFNTVDAIAEATKRLYDQNNYFSFQHFIFDLDFPLIKGDVMPDDIEEAKKENSIKLIELCRQYGSVYKKMVNHGVQPNWCRVFNILDIDDSDTICGVDPDEVVLCDNWVKDMAHILRSGNVAMVSLLQEGLEDYLKPDFYNEVMFGNIHAWRMKALFNWAFISFNGEFINKINRVLPHPPSASIYGHIEMLHHSFTKYGYDWMILPDHKVFHEVQEGTLLREWKLWLIHQNITPQINFETWIKRKSVFSEGQDL